MHKTSRYILVSISGRGTVDESSWWSAVPSLGRGTVDDLLYLVQGGFGRFELNNHHSIRHNASGKRYDGWFIYREETKGRESNGGAAQLGQKGGLCLFLLSKQSLSQVIIDLHIHTQSTFSKLITS